MEGLQMNSIADDIYMDVLNFDAEVKKRKGEEAKASEPFVSKFPVEAFPRPIQDIIIQTEKHSNYPIDFTSSAILFSLSVAIGQTHKVKFKEGWIESSAIWLAFVGEAGTNKSAPLTFITKPLYKVDQHNHKIYMDERKTYNAYHNSGVDKHIEREEPQKPTRKKMLLNDITIEAVASTHEDNIRGLGVVKDELAGWFKGFDKYSGGGGDTEHYLSLWSGKPIDVTRKTSEPILVADTFVSVCGGIQPSVLADMQSGKVDNGFMDRILIAYPKGLKRAYLSTTELASHHEDNWSDILNKLMDLEQYTWEDDGSVKPTLIPLSDDAKERMYLFNREGTDRVNDPNNEDNNLASIYSKIEIYVLRLALIIEMSAYACGESDKTNVSLESLEGAILLVNYFESNVLEFRDSLNATPYERLSEIEKKFYNELSNEFKTSEALTIGKKHNFNKQKLHRFLKKQKGLFAKMNRGIWRKI